jgi:hypothetical protein
MGQQGAGLSLPLLLFLSFIYLTFSNFLPYWTTMCPAFVWVSFAFVSGIISCAGSSLEPLISFRKKMK